jgi:hypothetical protein
MNYLATTAINLFTDGSLFFFTNSEAEQEKIVNEKTTQKLIEVFYDTVLPRCTSLSALCTLTLVSKKLNDNCQKVIQKQKVIFDTLSSQIPSYVPDVNKKDNLYLPRSTDHHGPIILTIPTKDNLMSISIQVENIKTLFICDNGDFGENGYSPWTLKVATPASMDELTSTVVRLALNLLNKDLRINTKKLITQGYTTHINGFIFRNGGGRNWESYERASYINYGKFKYGTEHLFNQYLEKEGYLGNLI